MNKKVELKKFSDIESANEIIAYLVENEYEYSIEETKSGYNLGMGTDIMDNQVTIWVNEADYYTMMSQEEVKGLIINDASEHYLYTFTDKDILEAINDPTEYTYEEIEMAKSIAQERGLITSNETVSNNPGENFKNQGFKTGYPKKPLEEIKTNSLRSSFISLGLFIGIFYLVFRWDLTYIFVLAGVILIHELGHFLAMRAFKYNDLGIFFVPLLGAFASGTKESTSQKQNVLVLLAGPVPGVLIGLVLYYFAVRDQSEFLIRTSNIFILINLFNLLPVMPLDGGKLIKSMFFENNELINKVFIFLSITLLTYISLSTKSYFLLVIPLLLLTQLGNISQIKKVKESVRYKAIDINKSYNQLTDQEYWMIRDEIGNHIRYFKQIITPGRYIVAENEQRIIKQVKSIVQKIPDKDLSIGGKILITFLWIMTFIIPFIAMALYFLNLDVLEKI